MIFCGGSSSTGPGHDGREAIRVIGKDIEYVLDVLAGLSSSRAKKLAEEKLQHILRHVASLSGTDTGADEGREAPRGYPDAGDDASTILSRHGDDDDAASTAHDSMFDDLTNVGLHATPADSAHHNHDNELYVQGFQDSCLGEAIYAFSLAPNATEAGVTPNLFDPSLATGLFQGHRQPADDPDALPAFDDWDPSTDWELLCALPELDQSQPDADIATTVRNDTPLDPDLASLEALLLQELQGTNTVTTGNTPTSNPLVGATIAATAPERPSSASPRAIQIRNPALHVAVNRRAGASASFPHVQRPSTAGLTSPPPSIRCAQRRPILRSSHVDTSPAHVYSPNASPNLRTQNGDSDDDMDMDADVPMCAVDMRSIAHISSPSTAALSHLPSPEDVCLHFDKHFGPSKQHVSLLLARLFFAVGSPEAQKPSNELHAVSHAHASNDLISTVRALDDLDTSTNLSHILRRCYLVRLLDNKSKLAQDIDDARLPPVKPAKRRLKHDFANIALLRTGVDPAAATTREAARKRGPKGRSRSLALSDLMRILYPNLTPKSSGDGAIAGNGHSEAYTRKMAKMKNRLSCARNWYQFEQIFSLPILALIPCGGAFSISIDQVEKLSRDIVKIFLEYLSYHRGAFLERMGEALSDKLYGVLTGADTAHLYQCEGVEEAAINDNLAESDELLSFCTIRSEA